MTSFMKKTCPLCPFSRRKTLWLHPDRAEEFAYMAQNPYTDFPCHKTADLIENEETGESGFVHGARSKTCHGFLTLQCSENGTKPEDFEPDGDGFEDVDEMIEHHAEHYAEEEE